MKAGKPSNRDTIYLGECISQKLLQINLHKILILGFKLHKLFSLLKEKSNRDVGISREFIGETSLSITDTIDKLAFHLNSLIGGEDVDIFFRIDRIKNAITKWFDKNRLGDKIFTEGTIGDEVNEVKVLLKRVMYFTTELSVSGDNYIDFMKNQNATAHDLLLYCYARIFSYMDNYLGRVKKDWDIKKGSGFECGDVSEQRIDWLTPDKKALLNSGDSEKATAIGMNSGAFNLVEGMREVFGSDFYNFVLDPSLGGCLHESLLIHSPEAITLYHATKRCRFILTANVCDAVAGNYIYLLCAPVPGFDNDNFRRMLLEKLIHWLDFAYFVSRGYIVSSTSKITRQQVEDYLYYVGTLLSYISSPKVSPSNDIEIQENVEFFMENII
jgi:hypothetical protein